MVKPLAGVYNFWLSSETFKLSVKVIELPVKHPELFDALGIAQPKVQS